MGSGSSASSKYKVSSVGEACQYLFETYDQDNNGYLDDQELAVLVKAIHSLLLPRYRFEFKNIDHNQDGKVTLDEFTKYVADAHVASAEPKKFFKALEVAYKNTPAYVLYKKEGDEDKGHTWMEVMLD
eukprot:gnl/MRDRNA2_/MRDRNA2_91303_c0_seq1.p1 gnl/MRDRNA2_/MRDRNA2_91303_c0~~gnl/MRDRNA2_/MRDRNA2_91303_c0_seq1.p1  ORF type:complete len:128 (+),score=28.23 gnl/MRDRNA2_/MRDRNA2_91303_c0_seq1:78-461(+)